MIKKYRFLSHFSKKLQIVKVAKLLALKPFSTGNSSEFLQVNKHITSHHITGFLGFLGISSTYFKTIKLVRHYIIDFKAD